MRQLFQRSSNWEAGRDSYASYNQNITLFSYDRGCMIAGGSEKICVTSVMLIYRLKFAPSGYKYGVGKSW